MFSRAASEIVRTRRLLGAEADLSGASVQRAEQGSESSSSSRRLPAQLEQLFVFAGLSAAERRAYLAALLLGVFLGPILTWLSGSPFALGISAASGFGFWQLLRQRVAKRARAFEADYPALLYSLASAVRTGLDPLVAFCQSRKLFSETSLVGAEVERVSQALEAGASEERALRGFGATVNHPDIPLFVTALLLARREGSGLSECLKRLVRVTRQRQSFRRKARAAVAMQRLSSFGIAGCALVIGILQVCMNPQGMVEAWNHPLGFKALCVGMTLMVAGVAWMMKITSTRS